MYPHVQRQHSEASKKRRKENARNGNVQKDLEATDRSLLMQNMDKVYVLFQAKF